MIQKIQLHQALSSSEEGFHHELPLLWRFICKLSSQCEDNIEGAAEDRW